MLHAGASARVQCVTSTAIGCIAACNDDCDVGGGDMRPRSRRSEGIRFSLFRGPSSRSSCYTFARARACVCVCARGICIRRLFFFRLVFFVRECLFFRARLLFFGRVGELIILLWVRNVGNALVEGQRVDDCSSRLARFVRRKKKRVGINFRVYPAASFAALSGV